MGGGELQLLIYGAQDILLKGNPSVSFFKKVFKTHTNFSMESIALPMNRTDANIYSPTTLTVKIDRNGDLVNYLYLAFTLPDIISNSAYNFRWIKNFAEAMIDNYSITIGGSLIEKNYGENLHVQHELSMNTDKRKIYDKMTGNTDEFTNPEKFVYETQGISNIPLRYRIGSTYPAAVDDNGNQTGGISINARKMYIPLKFWFNKEIGTSLPLIALQYSDTYINIELRPINELYKLLYNQGGIYDYFAPDVNNPEHMLGSFVTNMNGNYLLNPFALDMKFSLEVNYVFLDTLERSYFAYKPLEYLVEQTTRLEFDGLNTNSVNELVLQNPCKEITWFLRRNDVLLRNDWFNFGDNGQFIMQQAKFLFNGVDRFDYKDNIYFNYVQPFQHHTAINQDGIYVYSFALLPEEYAPSGSCNMSRVNKLQIAMQIRSPNDMTYAYDLIVYVTNNNFLKIQSGLAGVVFAL